MNSFPREVTIIMTNDRVLQEIDMNDYNEGSSQLEEVIGYELGHSIDCIEIDSWEEIPEGYTVMGEGDLEEYENYLQQKQKKKTFFL
jgi:hypothetical protein